MIIQPKSICILRLSAIGDVCHAISAVQAIQRQYPDCKITWITGKLEYQLLQYINNVEVIIFDKSQGKKEYLTLREKLKWRSFDVLLHMQAALRASLISLLIKAPVKIGFDKNRAKDLQWLFTTTKIDKAQSPHVLDGFMAFASKIGVKDLSVKWDINIPQETTQKTAQLINNKPSCVISPATSKVYKNWTTKGYSQLANYAISKGYQVFICGAPNEFEKNLAKEIIANTNHKAINLAGKTHLIELVSLIKEADLLLSPDTGAAHIATMFNTPVIGLYAHHNPKRTGPYFQQHNVVSVYETLITKETGKVIAELPWRARVNNKEAMKEISVASVISIFDSIHKKVKDLQ